MDSPWTLYAPSIEAASCGTSMKALVICRESARFKKFMLDAGATARTWRVPMGSPWCAHGDPMGVRVALLGPHMDPPWPLHGAPWLPDGPPMDPPSTRHGPSIDAPSAVYGRAMDPLRTQMDTTWRTMAPCMAHRGASMALHGPVMDHPWTLHGALNSAPSTRHGAWRVNKGSMDVSPWRSIDSHWRSIDSPQILHGGSMARSMEHHGTIYGPSTDPPRRCIDPPRRSMDTPWRSMDPA